MLRSEPAVLSGTVRCDRGNAQGNENYATRVQPNERRDSEAAQKVPECRGAKAVLRRRHWLWPAVAGRTIDLRRPNESAPE